MTPQVSVIIPIHNGEPWLKSCFESILHQTAIGEINIEVCVCDDASSDSTATLLDEWRLHFEKKNVPFLIHKNATRCPSGVGYAKNRAVSISSGDYLCFQDIDDIMLPNRICSQYTRALREPSNTILGSQFVRDPPESTQRYTSWANNLAHDDLNVQIYTSHGPTIIMPTWFCHRLVFDRVGGFVEGAKGTPEDLIFFYKHLDLSGRIVRVDECLLVYQYHPNAATFSVDEATIWKLRLERLQRHLCKWTSFTIWNAGKQGRKFYNSLTGDNRRKVVALCDVNAKLIGGRYVPYCAKTRTTGRPVPIIHFKDAQPPLVVCVKMDMTDGVFESNLNSLNLVEGVDYVMFG
uniref:Glycosyltransferase 2-like domain-containing protein n=1 Tax=Photinus pyralis TaxID=7054 RepID=A0A1Y1LIT6_PHOPY